MGRTESISQESQRYFSVCGLSGFIALVCVHIGFSHKIDLGRNVYFLLYLLHLTINCLS